jgi:geranylgeranyl diphosphate synthase type II
VSNKSSFDLRKYFAERTSLIDRSLVRYFKKSSQTPTTLNQAMRYGVFSGGKRFRPVLTLAVGELFHAKIQALLPFACAIELIHSYSLIHDDLPALDNDDLRRGKPSNHKRFGEGMALLAGDALLAEAFCVMSDPQAVRTLGSSLVSRLIHEVAEAAGPRGMVAGQSGELDSNGRRITVSVLESLQRLKTGALITTAARVGAIIGKARADELDRITRYGQCLGLAFQITDDILDARADSLKAQRVSGSGTHPVTDINYVSLIDVSKATRRARSLLATCLKEVEPFGQEAQPLREIARAIIERTE